VKKSFVFFYLQINVLTFTWQTDNRPRCEEVCEKRQNRLRRKSDSVYK